MSCSAARETDQYHGWECEVSGSACMYLQPDSKRCAEEYGEGPDAYTEEQSKDEILDDIILGEEGCFESEEDEIEEIANGNI